MGAPQTLPADFNGWDKPPATLPANFSQWDEPKSAQPQPGWLDREIPLDSYTYATESGVQSIARGTRDAVKSIIGMLDPRPQNDDEAAMVQQSSEAGPIALPVYRMLRSLGHTAKDATQIAGAIHDINQSSDPTGTYLKVAQQTAGQGAGQALTALATEGAARVAPGAANVVRGAADSETAGRVAATAKVLGHSAEEIPGVGGTIRAVKKLGQLHDIWGRPLDATGENTPYAGEDEPPASAPQPNPALTSPARTLPGQISPEVIGPHPQPAAPIPARTGLALPPGSAGSMAESVAAPPAAAETPAAVTPSGAGIPRTLSGESALRQILTGQDAQNLMKIARSRGINVTQEAQLKPSVAGPRLVNKIVDDFSQDELDGLRDQYLENTRMGRHNFGDIGAEANKTMSLQTYFPDVKIPAAQQIRTAAAIRNAASAPKPIATAPVTDVAQQIKQSAAAQPRTIVTDPATGRPEFSDVVAAKQQPAAAAPQAPPSAAAAAPSDMEALLKQSVKGLKRGRKIVIDPETGQPEFSDVLAARQKSTQ